MNDLYKLEIERDRLLSSLDLHPTAARVLAALSVDGPQSFAGSRHHPLLSSVSQPTWNRIMKTLRQRGMVTQTGHAYSARCAAVRQSDEMFCPACNLRWDTNDPHPPACKIMKGTKR